MNFEKLTIKHFISDLPRMLNKNFETIKTFIEKVFVDNGSNVTIGNDNLHLSGKFSLIQSNEVKASNIKILHNGNYVNLEDYIQEVVRNTVEDIISSQR